MTSFAASARNDDGRDLRNELPSGWSRSSSGGLRAAQLHGDESAEDARRVRSRIPGDQGVRRRPPALSRVADFGADAIMIDGAEPGSGEVFDWSLAEGAPSAGHRVLLAGGLHPGNVADAIARVRPWGVDVATGVESAPGRKDPVKLREFIANARAAGYNCPTMRRA